MKEIKDTIETNLIIKKSNFICTLIKVSSIEEVNDRLKEIRKKYYDARHNCYSYILGKDGSTYKYSDDGEPSQTAGIVIYNALSKNEVTNVLCVVTRYFGGIKLGAGGLVRAYSNSAIEALNKATLLEIVDYAKVKFSFSYSYTTIVINYLKDYEKLDQLYSEDVSLTYSIPISKINEVKAHLIEELSGNIKISIVS